MQDNLHLLGLSAVFLSFGLVGLLVPAKAMISWDRFTGYCIYTNVLNSTGDETKALRAAGLFYRMFGGVFFLSGGWVLWVVLG